MAKPQFAFSTTPLSVTSVCFSTGDNKYIYPDENSRTGTGERVVNHGVSMKDVTFGAVREIAGGKAGMDDNSESGTLLFVPSNKGESLSSLFLILMYQFWLHIYIYRIFVLLHMSYLPTTIVLFF